MELMITEIAPRLRPTRISEIPLFLSICKEINEKARSEVLKGWVERFHNGEVTEEYEMMVNKDRKYTPSAYQMRIILKREAEKPTKDFVENLYQFQRYVVEREWFDKNMIINNEAIGCHHLGKDERPKVPDLFYYEYGKVYENEIVDVKVTALDKMQNLSIVEMTHSRASLLNQIRDFIKEKTKDCPMIGKLALGGGLKKKKKKELKLRYVYYELKKNSPDPLPTHAPNKDSSIRDVIIDDHHIFSTYPTCKNVRRNIRSCLPCTSKTPIGNKSYVLQRCLMREENGESLLENLSLTNKSSSFSSSSSSSSEDDDSSLGSDSY